MSMRQQREIDLLKQKFEEVIERIEALETRPDKQQFNDLLQKERKNAEAE